MIEIYYKNNDIIKYKSIDEIEYLPNNIFSVFDLLISIIQIWK